MKCMKCGAGISSGQVFCEECLTDMEKHPVAPGTPVLLPRHEKQVVTKRSRKRVKKPEEQVAILRRVIILLLVVITLLSAALTMALYSIFTEPEAEAPSKLPGQNYGTSSAMN